VSLLFIALCVCVCFFCVCLCFCVCLFVWLFVERCNETLSLPLCQLSSSEDPADTLSRRAISVTDFSPRKKLLKNGRSVESAVGFMEKS
jgi:hypothetical protein